MALIYSLTAYGQGDWAIFETFSRNAPAVYSISVEIPQEHIIKSYEDSIKRLNEYQENLTEDIFGGSGKNAGNSMLFENMINRIEKHLKIYVNQLMSNNYLRGAGFAIDNEHLVTLSTVVRSATLGGEITLMDDHSQRLKANLLGLDETTGIAVLKVEDASFSTYVDVTRISGMLPIASYIMTIQRPYDLHASPFSGMIGGYYRTVGLFEYERYIQADLPLFPGNDGAPVFSPSGQLIGMLATEYHREGWPGISFIIPGDMVLDSAREIIANGTIEHGWIPGIEFKQDISGIIIEKLEETSPAKMAGLQKGDIITGFNGQRVNQGVDLIYYILNARPNELVQVEIQRGTQRIVIPIKTSKRTEG
jgi:serine protease Do